MNSNIKIFTCGIIALILMIGSIVITNNKSDSIQTNSDVSLSNTKIEWGIKRGNNNEQPDLGSKNRSLIEKYNGMAMGNKDSKNIYVTFDLGYEAGYTAKILDRVIKKIKNMGYEFKSLDEFVK